MSRTVRSLHTEAMHLAEGAWFAEREHDPIRARHLFRRAANLERKCVDIVRDIPDNEPTFSILSESLAALEASARRGE